jgi:hypothetical protein
LKLENKIFIIKRGYIAFIGLIALICLNALIVSIEPVFANEIAMGQMETSNEGFVAWSMYNNLRPILIGIYYLGCAGWGWFVGTSTFKAIKRIKTEETNM